MVGINLVVARLVKNLIQLHVLHTFRTCFGSKSMYDTAPMNMMNLDV